MHIIITYKVSIEYRAYGKRRQTNRVNEKLPKNIHKHYQLHIYFLSVKIAARFNRKHLVDHEIINSWKCECPVSCL